MLVVGLGDFFELLIFDEVISTVFLPLEFSINDDDDRAPIRSDDLGHPDGPSLDDRRGRGHPLLG